MFVIMIKIGGKSVPTSFIQCSVVTTTMHDAK